MTTYAKSLVAKAMYEKGRAFARAALLVNQENGNAFVVLHLLCQGIEIVLKALLLAKLLVRNAENCDKVALYMWCPRAFRSLKTGSSWMLGDNS